MAKLPETVFSHISLAVLVSYCLLFTSSEDRLDIISMFDRGTSWGILFSALTRGSSQFCSETGIPARLGASKNSTNLRSCLRFDRSLCRRASNWTRL